MVTLKRDTLLQKYGSSTTQQSIDWTGEPESKSIGQLEFTARGTHNAVLCAASTNDPVLCAASTNAMSAATY